MHVEASIDFPEEEIAPADLDSQGRRVAALRLSVAELLGQARQGAILRDGLTVVLAGRPNVGKSSLLNQLAGEEVAIVTSIAGTTRDTVRATVILEGVPVHLIDTAGLREASDEVERIGIERTWAALANAGAAVFLEDAGAPSKEEAALRIRLPAGIPIVRVLNKIDLTGEAPGRNSFGEPLIRLSAKTGSGVEALKDWLLEVAGWKPHDEGIFMARQRHLIALERAAAHLNAAFVSQVIELKAEELRLAQREMGTITGQVSPNELLGEIFSRFCIGK